MTAQTTERGGGKLKMDRQTVDRHKSDSAVDTGETWKRTDCTYTQGAHKERHTGYM